MNIDQAGLTHGGISSTRDPLVRQDTTGSNDVLNVLENGVQLFTQALGPCFDTLGVAERIAEDIEDLYC